MGNENVLIVEDDADIREGVRILLKSEGYVVDEAENGQEGVEKTAADTDLVILDVMMPVMSGITACRRIREKSNVPILFLTAKTMESDKLIGLMAGGDDYLPKPFSYSELLGRVKALIRRYRVYQGKGSEETKKDGKYLTAGRLKVHKQFNEVYVDGIESELSNIEYHILLLLMESPGKIYSAQEIYENVWNEPYFYSCNSTIMVHMRKLRVKIEKDPQNPRLLRTVWGKGYKFENVEE